MIRKFKIKGFMSWLAFRKGSGDLEGSTEFAKGALEMAPKLAVYLSTEESFANRQRLEWPEGMQKSPSLFMLQLILCAVDTRQEENSPNLSHCL